MPIKINETDIILVETVKIETINDLMHFDIENADMFKKFGFKNNNLDKIAESITKLISNNIQVNILNYMYKIMEDTIKKGDN